MAAGATPRQSPQVAVPHRRGRRGFVLAGLVCVPLLAAAWFGGRWAIDRYSRSLTRDAFLDSDLINVSAYAAGDIVEIFVQEQSRVTKGQLLARIDPAVYQHEVDVKTSQLAVAEAALRKSQADLAVAQAEVPVRVRIAERKLDLAREDEAKAQTRLELTTEDVDKGIKAAAAAVTGCKAALALAAEDYTRYRDLAAAGTVTKRQFQESTKLHDVARAELEAAQAKLAQAEATRHKVTLGEQELRAARHAVAEARAGLELARTGELTIDAVRQQLVERTQAVESARQALRLAKTNLGYTRIVAPYDGIITKNWRHLGDHVRPGDPIFNMYNPQLLYVTVHLEETLLEGVNLGNYATVHVDAFGKPFQARVVWIGSATDANFSLVPRDVSAGEFTYVVQRVTTRLALEPDDRLPRLKPGLSAHVAIEHGPGDPSWADAAWQRMAELSGVREQKQASNDQ